MGVDETPYNIVLVLHLLVVIAAAGFGMMGQFVIKNAVKDGQPSILPTFKAVYKTFKGPASIATYLIPVFGFALVGMSDKAIEFSDTWIWLSTLLWVALVGISHGVLLPTDRKLIAAMESGDAAAIPGYQKTLQSFGPVMGLLTVALVYLMVFKPA